MRDFDGNISTIIFKLTSTCNLKCPYCYMFEHGDESHKIRENQVSDETVDSFVLRVKNYLSSRDSRLLIIFHGGEPLLIGASRLDSICRKLQVLKDFGQIDLAVQTNGTVINEEILAICVKYEVRIGISLDGPKRITNKNRPYKGGKYDTYDEIIKGISLIQEHLPEYLFGGALAVIDLNISAKEMYHHFRELGIESMDFLLPLRNYENDWGYDEDNRNQTPYGIWLMEMFQEWVKEDNSNISIRVLRSVIENLLGSSAPRADIQHSAMDVITVETDGAIEPVDDLRISEPNFNRTDLNVKTNEFDDFFDSKKFLELSALDENQLPIKCQTCKYLHVCGSGGLSYRKNKIDFNTPSIYCQDIYHFVDGINAFLIRNGHIE